MNGRTHATPNCRRNHPHHHTVCLAAAPLSHPPAPSRCQVLNNGDWTYVDSPDDCCSQCANTKVGARGLGRWGAAGGG